MSSFKGYAHLDPTTNQIPSGEMAAGLYTLTSSYIAGYIDLDMKTTGATYLYEVPAGKSLFVTGLRVLCTAITSQTIPPTIRVGLPSAYTEYFAATSITGLTAVGKWNNLQSTTALAVNRLFNAGEIIYIDVTIGATATTLTYSFFMDGILI